MKTSNKILAAGILVVMVLMAIGMGKAKSILTKSMIKPSGNVIERTYDVAAFSKINLTNNIECTLKKADTQLVKVEIDEAFIEKLSVNVSGEGYLGFDFDGFVPSEPIKITIHYTELSKLTLKNANCTGEIIADSISHLFVIAGSNLNATMQTSYCNLMTSSGSTASLNGSCTSLNSNSKSGGEIEATDLKTDHCIAVASSGGRSKLNVSKTLSATAKSGGNISYLGNPEMTGLEVKSGGSVSKQEMN